MAVAREAGEVVSYDIIEREGVEAGLRFWVVGRIGLGHRCGYVELPEGHPWRDALGEYDECIPTEAHDVAHGGLTWLGPLGPEKEEFLPSNPFVAGFDAAHLGDCTDPVLKPRFERLEDRGSIKTADYMERSARALACVAAKSLNKNEPSDAQTSSAPTDRS